MTVVVPLLIGVLYVLLNSLIAEPHRRRFNAVMVAGAGAAYLSGGGLGIGEFVFTALLTYLAYRGLESWTFIGAGWLLHTAWDVVHHLRGEPIIPLAHSSSLGCAICDPVIAIWCLAGGPSLWQYANRWRRARRSRSHRRVVSRLLLRGTANSRRPRQPAPQSGAGRPDGRWEGPMNILVTGATGRLGRVLTPELARAGHAVRAASRTPAASDAVERVRLDLVTGDGLTAAVRGMDTVVHLASAPYQGGYTRRVEVDGTRRLVDAAGQAGVRHLVYLSIVGADRVPWPYFKAKVEAEAIVAAGSVPWTVLRVTQFHELLDETLTRLARLPVLPVDPRIVGQPVDVRDVAEHLVRRVATPPGGTVEEFAGPAVLGSVEGLRDWLAARRVRRPMLRLPVPGRLGRAFRAGALVATRGDRGRIGWSEYLAGDQQPRVDDAAHSGR